MFYIFILITLIAPISNSSKTAGGDWRTFESREGYSIRFPATWWGWRGDSGSLWLQIASSRLRGHGVPIGSGQARITVRRVTPDFARTIELTDDVTSGDRHRSIRTLPARGNGTCEELREIRVDEEVGPRHVMKSIQLLCRICSSYILSTLNYWPGDRSSGLYNLTLNRMANTIHLIR